MKTSLALLLFGYLLSLLLFQSAFLVRRRELGLRSTCADAQVRSRCWLRPQVNRVIIFIVDALRYDFVAPQADSSVPFHNQMLGVASLTNSFLIPFIADPPTTTLQRLKALTTGTFPTFIDAGDNFADDVHIVEDNLIDQLVAANKNVTFLGDDTWITLYPTQFSRAFPFPSFDVKDLHTVDRGVLEHLWTELERGDWTLLIAHFLGVDHCGHKYGPSHPEMKAKLKEMDEVITRTAKQLKDDELLIVIGDHGMTSDGDHGGDSTDEVTAALLAVRPGGFRGKSTDAVSQIDLVPTLSLLLGVPVPFSSLGVVIEDFFNEDLIDSAWELNIEQMRRFVKTYSEGSESDVSNLLQTATTKEERQRAARKIQNEMRDAWTRFDVPLMHLSLAALVETLLFNYHHAYSSKALSLVVRSGMLLLQLTLLHSGLENYLAASMLSIALSVCMVSHVFMLLPHMLDVLSLEFSPRTAFVFALPLFHSLSFLSNSYVVREAQTLRFYLQTLLILGIVDLIKSSRSRVRGVQSGWRTRELVLSVLALIALRFEEVFHRCREEEGPDCVQFPFAMPFLSLSLNARLLRFVFGIVSGAILNWRFCVEGERRITNATTSLIRASSWTCLLLVIFHWSTDWIPESPAIRSVSLHVAQAVFLWVIVSSVLYWVAAESSSTFFFGILHSVSLLALLLLRDGLTPALLLFFFLVYTLQLCIMNERERIVALSLLVSYGFYLLGHQPCFTLIPWTAAFIGIPGNFFLRAAPALLVGLHIFSSSVIGSLLASLLLPEGSVIPFLSFCALRGVLVSVAALIHRRHLMVWKIFAPKYIFESLSLLVVCATLNVVFLVAPRKQRVS